MNTDQHRMLKAGSFVGIRGGQWYRIGSIDKAKDKAELIEPLTGRKKQVNYRTLKSYRT